MPKTLSLYRCAQCGASHSKWSGQCGDCGAWNSLSEEQQEHIPGAKKPSLPQSGKALKLVKLSAELPDTPRVPTHIGELDRVLGGGIVAGAATLIGGDPGIGKSTLLLQMVASLSRKGTRCLYLSGEESQHQIGLRASRLKLMDAGIELGTGTMLEDILSLLEKERPQVAIIDSIQTLYSQHIDAAPATVSQLRHCGYALIRAAKKHNIAIFLVGHVTKEGVIAGPRVLEHMVDTVLYFEGERGHAFRLLRAIKHRFGGTDEMGVFDMTEEGMIEVTNPSALFLTDREEPVSGSAVLAAMEGSRPLLVEIQALIAPSNLATPRRAVVGWDSGRLAMLLAVLEARCGISLSQQEVYVNIAGGLKITEPAADLAIAAALLSSLYNIPIPSGMVLAGEIGLSGEVRPVPHVEKRLKEAEKLGFSQAIIPSGKKPKLTSLKPTNLAHLDALARTLFPDAAA